MTDFSGPTDKYLHVFGVTCVNRFTGVRCALRDSRTWLRAIVDLVTVRLASNTLDSNFDDAATLFRASLFVNRVCLLNSKKETCTREQLFVGIVEVLLSRLPRVLR